MMPDTETKQPIKGRDPGQKDAGLGDLLTWLPSDPKTGRRIDGRTQDARQMKARI